MTSPPRNEWLTAGSPPLRIALYLVAAGKISQSFGMVPVSVRNKEILQQDFLFFNKCINLFAETARIDKRPNTCHRVGHQISVDREAPYRKTFQNQIIYHHAVLFGQCVYDMHSRNEREFVKRNFVTI